MPFVATWLRFALFTTVFLSSMAGAADRRGGECGKVDDWLLVVSEWSQGRDLNRLRHEQVRQLILPALHDEVMKDVWGDAYADLSSRQHTSIFKALNKCASEAWVRYFLTIPFSDPPERIKQAPRSDYAQWQAAIQSVNRQPYAALQAQRQQQVAMAEHVAQRRADAVVAAQSRREQMARIQQEQVRQANLEADRRISVVSKHAESGPFRGAGASYLNALYVNDRDALAEYDRMFAGAYSEGMSLYQGSAADAMARLFMGEAGAKALGQKMQTAVANLSMVTSVAGVYVLYYEHVYPDCMEAKPLVYERTREYEWVTRNGLGTVLSRSPAWSTTDVFKINHRFEYVWNHMGDIEKGNATMVDHLLGKPGAIRLSDAMNAMSRSMGKFTCDSPEIRQLETNMLAYFGDAVAKMDRAMR